MAGVVKIGPWGGDEGEEWDIPTAVTPKRLESITICGSIAAIDAISFRFRDENGKWHRVGVWGGKGGDPWVIRLENEEFVTEMLGTFSYTGTQPGDVVTSLAFITNLRRYGPYGDTEPDGTPFSVRVHNGGSIVAFFCRAKYYIDAIGVYIHP